MRTLAVFRRFYCGAGIHCRTPGLHLRYGKSCNMPLPARSSDCDQCRQAADGSTRQAFCIGECRAEIRNDCRRSSLGGSDIPHQRSRNDSRDHQAGQSAPVPAQHQSTQEAEPPIPKEISSTVCSPPDLVTARTTIPARNKMRLSSPGAQLRKTRASDIGDFDLRDHPVM